MLNQIIIPSPLGDLVGLFSHKGLCLLEFSDQCDLNAEISAVQKQYGKIIKSEENPQTEALRRQLSAYFAGKLQNFTIPLDVVGTAFQRSVWAILETIAYGTTISYQEEALLLNRPTAVRAVANANGQNKISIIIPCHRVIGKNGTLTGYGGGLNRKKFLLDLEALHSLNQ